MDEFAFIQSIQPSYYRQSSVIKGIGDDAAILRQTHQDLITTVDTMVESIHFSAKTTEPFHIGYRVLAANISDIVAMGGRPTAYLVSIVIPSDWKKESLQAIYQGMDRLASKYQMDLIGGDTVSGKQLTISITVFGAVNKHNARYRSHAEAGDVVFVTGTIGDSACGLDLLLNEDEKTQKQYPYFIKSHQMPEPPASFIKATSSIKRMALNDISDGIANESNEIADASNVTLMIDYEKIPRHPKLANFPKKKQRNWLLSGGEDFELIGTISPEEWEVLESIAEQNNTKITSIGKVVEAEKHHSPVLIQKDNRFEKLNKSGYTHLRGEDNE